jgi:hypothetical protein
MLDKLRRITLDRGEGEAGSGGEVIKSRLRAKSFSTTGEARCCGALCSHVHEGLQVTDMNSC